jgi:signal transduction histidine kinase
MRHDIEARKHSFTVLLPDVPVQVQADIGYLRMAVENLINNARVYTPDGGAIALKLLADTKQAKIVVEDTGVGIHKKDLTKLFAKFSRIHNELSVQAGGSGIGLYLAGEIIRLHGGSISVSSKINKGTTFTITLPLAHAKPRVVESPKHITVS